MPLHFPEPFAALLEAQRYRDASNLPAATGEELWARGFARWHIGMESEARADFEACRPELGERAAIELAFLDIRDRGALEPARAVAQRIASSAPHHSELHARAQHVLGLAEGKLRHVARSFDALREALEMYRLLGDLGGESQVRDTLGMLCVSIGRLDLAASHYAASVASKTRLNDRYGLALSLGQLGRLSLRAGRFEEALDFFEQDLALARELSDAKAEVQLLGDLGRTRAEWVLASGSAELPARTSALGTGPAAKDNPARRLEQAERELGETLARAEAQGYRDLEFFSRKERALLFARTGRGSQALEELTRAERLMQGVGEPYYRSLVQAARGEALLSAGEPGALEALESAAAQFRDNELPDLEIETLIALAQAYLGQQRAEFVAAEECLAQAAARARADGFARYLPRIRATMARLRLKPGLAEVDSTLLRGSGKETVASQSLAGGYVLLERLGKGAFGEVWRAFDPDLMRVIALKRIRLGELYSPAEREVLEGTLRNELDAVARTRHPGVARVWALWSDHEGELGVIQEYVPGTTLLAKLPARPNSEVSEVLRGMALLARTLEAIHPALVHCDLKPANVILRSGDGTPVMIDFGIARVLGNEPEWMESRVMGTREYMSPEQAAGKPGPQTDVYALGVILHEWLTGVRPLRLPHDATATQVVRFLEKRKPTPLSDDRPGLPRDLLLLVGQMLAKNPKHRPLPAQVASRCEALLATLPPRVAAPNMPDRAALP